MAAMKTSVGRLYMLFNACLPENEKVKKRLNISKIAESNEYNELKNYTPFKSEFEKSFSLDQLSKYDCKKIEEIIKAIPKIIPLIENIVNSINYGDVSSLSEEDIPDFTSQKSIDELAGKLKVDQANPNITNITKDNFMAVFSNKTIKDPTDALKSISAYDIKKPVEAVKKNLSKNTYCIKAKDVAAIQDEYAARVAEVNNKLDGVKKDRWKLRYKKWLYIGIAIILLTIINTFELLSPDNGAILTVLSALLLIAYFFIG